MHRCIGLCFLSVAAIWYDGDARLGLICSDVAALLVFHQSWKPPEVESLSFKNLLSPCSVVRRSLGVDVNLDKLVLCRGAGSVACLTNSRNHTRSALWPLMQGHVTPNQLELLTGIPHGYGNGCQGWACISADSICLRWHNYYYLSLSVVCEFEE